jgi:GT2 family glycosyltransferase
MKIDIVIVNWNAGTQLSDCIASVRAHHAGRVGKCIVVDNGSSDGSADFLKDAPDVDLVLAGQNLGFGAACNMGAARGQSDLLLFLNPDACLLPGSLDQPAAYLEAPENKMTGVVGVGLVGEDSALQRSCDRFPTPTGLSLSCFGLHRIFPKLGIHMVDWDHMDSRNVPHVIGAFYLIRRSLFQDLNGFDQRFFVYFEDMDLSLRVNKAEFDVFYLSSARAFHKGNGVSDQVKAHRLFYSLRSRIQFCRKHFPAPAMTVVAVLTLLAEPIARLGLLLASRRWAEIGDLWRGYAMLWGWVLVRLTGGVRS